MNLCKKSSVVLEPKNLNDFVPNMDNIPQPNWQKTSEHTLRQIAQHIKPPKPVEIRFQGVTWSVKTNPHTQRQIQMDTVGTKLNDVLGAVRHKIQGGAGAITTHILHDLTGVLKPAQMTLVLGKPGCGKSSFLKLLAHDLRPDSTHTLTGSVTYNGERADSGSFAVKRVVTYIDQHDTHLPTLTVAETINFAFQMKDEYQVLQRTEPNSPATQLTRMMNERNLRVNQLLHQFGLDHVRDTLVGDDLIRGISGGQRKRVTLCEKLVGNFRVLLGDQITSGLDSATAIDIMTAMRQSTKALEQTSVFSLLQPPPEVYGLFDNVVLLEQGQIVYLGPVSRVLSHFSALGFHCPPNVDTADFLQEIPSPEGSKFWSSHSPDNLKKQVPPHCSELVQAYRSTDTWRDILNTLATPNPTAEWRPEQKAEFLQSWPRSTKLLIKRQMILSKRNKGLLRVQIGQSIVMGLIIGSLFYKLNRDQYANKYGLMFITSMVCIGGMPALPVYCAQRPVFYKQRDAGFFSASSYVAAQAIALAPINIAQVMNFGTLMWWMSGMTHDQLGSRYGMFLVVSLCLSFSLGQLLRAVAAFSPNANTATPIAGLCFTFAILLSGFIIQEHSIPSYWIWLYWINPIAWFIRAFAILEFTSSQYNVAVPSLGGAISTLGNLYLEAYGFRKEMHWVWAAVLFMIGFMFAIGYVTTWSLEKLRLVPVPSAPIYGRVEAGENSKGPIRVTSTKATHSVGIPSDNTAEEDPVLPFSPITLTFENIYYSVQVKSNLEAKGKTNLDLLQGVSGFATPGSLTALMGSSGAGKTTLLDVIAGRKTTGSIRGNILLNGQKNVRSFARLMGYVEQADVHSPRSTVAEALNFSARLRLPSHVSTATCSAFVNQVMRLLELDSLKGHVVGREGEGGLSTEQRKRLTIGVEMVANPSVLFLDEPTTGLDSRAAAIVMRVVRNIAATKRTVICTIHQPSEYLFYMFDRMLLLKPGGKTVYFGPLGDNSSNLLTFLHSIPGTAPMQQGSNPATFMLEVIGGGTDAGPASNSASGVVDAAEVYNQSSVKASSERELQALKHTMASQTQAHTSSHHDVAPLHVQITQLTVKAVRGYWRLPSYNLSRSVVTIVVACIFGSLVKRAGIHSQGDVISQFSVMMIACAFTCIVYLTSVIDIVVTERAVFYREQAAGMYSTAPFALSFVVAELPYLVVNTFMFSVIFYFTVGFYDDGVKFGYFWLYFMLIVSTATFCGQMLACLAPSSHAASVMAMLLLNIWLTTSGFLISPRDIPDYWIWLHWMSPFHYLLEGLVVTQFHDANMVISVISNQGHVHTTVEQYASVHFGGKFKYSQRGNDVLALMMFIAGFNVIRIVALKHLQMLKR